MSRRVVFEGVRAGLRALEAASPALAAVAAEQVFRRPTRHARPRWERDVLADATPTRIAHAGSTLPAWSWGAGPLVILVHGWEGRGAQLGAHVAPLVRAGFRVLAFDAPGHGDAEGDRSSVIEISQALRSALDAAGPAHAIVAHSVGCVATTFALARRPATTCARLVFYSPPSSPRRFTEQFARAVGISEDTRALMARRIEARYGISLAELELLDAAPSRAEPLLVVHDEDDRDVPVSVGEAIAQRWPNAKLKRTQGLGHRRILRDPAVLDEVVAFVREGHATPARGAVGWDALFEELYDRGSRAA